MDNSPLERDGIARENLGNGTIYKLMVFVNVRVVLHKHSGDHYGPASDEGDHIKLSYRAAHAGVVMPCYFR